MEFSSALQCQGAKVEVMPFRGRVLEVKGTTIRWLSREGEDNSGNPEYGLRHFTIEPGGEIPIHEHFYHQTMYFLSGTAECLSFDSRSEEIKEKRIARPGDYVFVPSMEVHGMKNAGDDPVTFLCCIGTVYDRE